MNYPWTKIAERGQYELGFIDIFEIQLHKKAIAIIHYLPQHTHKNKRVIFTLILEGSKADWTEGTLHKIFEDAESGIRDAEGFKFNNVNQLDYMDTQIFSVKNIEDFDYFSHGDYNFICRS